MITKNRFLRTAAFLVVLTSSVAHAITFTNDTNIGISNSSYDGQAIVATNCVLTIDGPHSFDTVHLLNGAILTHTFSTNGILRAEVIFSVPTESHILSSTNPPVLNNSYVRLSSVAVSNLTGTVFQPGLDYTLISSNSLTLIALTAGSAIPDGTMILVSYQVDVPAITSGLFLTVSNDFSIDPGANVNVTGKGFGGGAGPGAGSTQSTNYPFPFSAGSGAGHGGTGVAISIRARGGTAYGSILTPAEPGSGGGAGSGPGGNGGGIVNVTVGGQLRIDGTISADGANAINLHSGGGSGGSVWLTAGTLAGSGLISVLGGAGETPDGGGGGGGRIAVHSSTNLFLGSYSARGGRGISYAGAGTVYVVSNIATNGQLLIDNGGFQGTSTPLSLPFINGLDFVISGGAVATVNTPLSVRNLTIRSNSWFESLPATNLTINASGDVVLETSGGISGDGKGNPNGGIGLGRTASLTGFCTGGGGSYGGFGGASAYGAGAGPSYGQIVSPIDVGSSGGNGGNCEPFSGGAGGGAIHLSVLGKLTLDGRISADGAAGTASGSGGGSGGSVWLSLNDFSGSGKISANGAPGETPLGGGGGGGRVALYFNGTNTFAGPLTARGGSGANNGGAGTIYTRNNRLAYGQLILDNDGLVATNSLVTLQGVNDLILRGNATMSTSSGIIGNLLIESNSWITTTTTSGLSLSLTVQGNLTVQQGAGIFVDGKGSFAGTGTGPGRSLSGAGGGHGGYGGNGVSGSGGGTAYGTIISPVEPGSGGGSGKTGGLGGPGGGSLRLTVTGTLALDGIISANGGTATGQGAGGGGGGSVYITAGKLSGIGSISADGGSGDLPYGGGGGGGRIALYYTTNLFGGTISAHGGAGFNFGGAGALYLKGRIESQFAQVILDNGGVRSTNTPLFVGDSVSVIIRGGAVASAGSLGSNIPVIGTGALGDLLVASNSCLIISNANSSRALLNVLSNVTIQAGGSLLLDGMGFTSGQGRGSGRTLSSFTNGFTGLTGGGGGYGGNGGSSFFGAAGGGGYGSISEPLDLGSGGGVLVQDLPPNSGGGALQMTVNGSLVIDGSLIANGLPGVAVGSGGGSGGSLWLTAGKFSGSGLIAANGGSGHFPYGGGGGAGRIAIIYGTNLFTGSISALGGAGANYGGAGTIYLRSKNQSGFAQVSVDNGGHNGANTTLGGSGLIDLTLRDGASLTVGTVSAGGSLLFRNLLINSNAWLTGASNQAVQVTASNLTIQAGGGITLNGLGNPSSQGPGAGSFFSSVSGFTGNGGGYGGYGGASIFGLAEGGNSYGSITQPTEKGSGGGAQTSGFGSAGGGAIRLTVAGTLALDGIITANGGNAATFNAGGGSGGSVWVSAATVMGSGSISANGGSGDYPQGGGGGGGRIAVYFQTNQFTGAMSSFGGAGATYGGAGTIYSRGPNQPVGVLRIDNAGRYGTNTPLASPEAFNVTLSGGAVANPASGPLVLGGLWIDSGARITLLPSQTNLEINVLGNAVIQTNGSISTDGEGYRGYDGGPGAGTILSNVGSGAGYGGAGGASATGAPGGASYGSAFQPTDRGSRGGSSSTLPGFSQGGGAILFRVSSNLTVNGWISANGNDAILDGAGGGSGGSIWLTARQIDGYGLITANGGIGEDSGGGGGGGGRIAINSRANAFAGSIYAAGAPGWNPGQDGTILITNIPAPQVVAQTPSGVVNYNVGDLELAFNSPLNFSTVSGADFTLETPIGFVLPQGTVSAVVTNLATIHLNFPAQTNLGYYEIQAGPQIEDIYGQAMSMPYFGSFVILPPTISGRVTDVTGAPVPYVTLRPSRALQPTVSDVHGFYSLEVSPGWFGTITASRGTAQFVPPYRNYDYVASDLTNQDFTLITPSALALVSSQQGANLNLAWPGINGANYQVFVSPDLVNWTFYTNLPGMPGPMNLALPIGPEPNRFFKINLSY